MHQHTRELLQATVRLLKQRPALTLGQACALVRRAAGWSKAAEAFDAMFEFGQHIQIFEQTHLGDEGLVRLAETGLLARLLEDYLKTTPTAELIKRVLGGNRGPGEKISVEDGEQG
jgi:hypothetical protein